MPLIKTLIDLEIIISYFDANFQIYINSSPPGQNGCHFADNIFRCIFVNEKFCILIKISLKFVPKGPIWSSIGSDNGLAPIQRQVIIWTNTDKIHWHIHAAQQGNKLTICTRLKFQSPPYKEDPWCGTGELCYFVTHDWLHIDPCHVGAGLFQEN